MTNEEDIRSKKSKFGENEACNLTNEGSSIVYFGSVWALKKEVARQMRINFNVVQTLGAVHRGC